MKSAHLMGVGGTGMVSLAGLLKDEGWQVRGSDKVIYPPASEMLARLSVEIRQGFSPENLKPVPDLVVVGNVISRTNLEAQALLASNIPYTSMAQALGDRFLKGRRSVVVTGTHGKTTTTSCLAYVLDNLGQAPGFFVGGLPANFDQSYQLGQGECFVVEGDEYDTAFFEKTPKFLHYRPHDVILTSLEFDHADIYPDLNAIERQFSRLVKIIPESGSLIACGDTEIVRRVAGEFSKNGLSFYGFSPENNWRPDDIRLTKSGSRFDVLKDGKKVCGCEIPLWGRHNVLNCVAVIAMVNRLGFPPEATASALRKFKGVHRRQEFVGEVRGIRIYDDFAHHPTAIQATIESMQGLRAMRKGKLWAVFEPRSNTFRRRIFEKALTDSFSGADEVILAPVYRKADSLTDKEMFRPGEVVKGILLHGISARAAVNHEEILSLLMKGTKEGDLVLFMSNGDFGKLPLRVLELLKS